MSRRRARVTALEILFQVESRGPDGPDDDTLLEICDEALQRNRITVGGGGRFVKELVLGTWENRSEYDEAIAGRSEGWPLHRIGRVEVAIMRMALHELWRMDTPCSVVIDEAVELAKQYASSRAASFVNGILGSLVART